MLLLGVKQSSLSDTGSGGGSVQLQRLLGDQRRSHTLHVVAALQVNRAW